jgi:protoporphyrinogen oxidase
MITILGAGLAGLSCSFHLGHSNCVIFERNSYSGGHIYSHERNGFIWDEGPHVSFTKREYVQSLFEESVRGEYNEFPVKVGNYYQGQWIPHPAQCNLWALPEPLRTDCLGDFLQTRQTSTDTAPPSNYGEWLSRAFGETFTEHFPAVYTRKYWTREPCDLAVDWVGERVFYPDVQTVVRGYRQQPTSETHYIKTIRYPTSGGFTRFADRLRSGANIRFSTEVVGIDLRNKELTFANGQRHCYSRLINTLPLPEFIAMTRDVPADIRAAAGQLCCSSLLLVNITARQSAVHPFHWIYVYDHDKLATRISYMDRLAPNNAPIGMSGLQVEVYGSRYRPFAGSPADVMAAVVREVKEMGLIEDYLDVHVKEIPYANVIFDLERGDAQSCILDWLARFGLERETDDMLPMIDWTEGIAPTSGSLCLAGRFAQWKYFWTDDCVLRGQYLARSIADAA